VIYRPSTIRSYKSARTRQLNWLRSLKEMDYPLSSRTKNNKSKSYRWCSYREKLNVMPFYIQESTALILLSMRSWSSSLLSWWLSEERLMNTKEERCLAIGNGLHSSKRTPWLLSKWLLWKLRIRIRERLMPSYCLRLSRELYRLIWCLLKLSTEQLLLQWNPKTRPLPINARQQNSWLHRLIQFMKIEGHSWLKEMPW
jgi:hypothetical protein